MRVLGEVDMHRAQSGRFGERGGDGGLGREGEYALAQSMISFVWDSQSNE